MRSSWSRPRRSSLRSSGLRISSQVGTAPKQRRECDLRLRARQLRTQTEVNTLAERQMSIVRAPQIEAIGLLELQRITVRRAQQQQYETPRIDLSASDLERPRGQTIRGLYRAVVA